jgi:hypothetical protein
MASVTADHGEGTSWGDDDPSVFVINRGEKLQGEYQLCNGYGVKKATEVLRVRYESLVQLHLTMLDELWKILEI